MMTKSFTMVMYLEMNMDRPAEVDKSVKTAKDKMVLVEGGDESTDQRSMQRMEMAIYHHK